MREVDSTAAPVGRIIKVKGGTKSMLLFGSRARGEARIDSDIDIFIEDDEEVSMIPRAWLIDNGGPVDAFEMPNGDGTAFPLTDNEDSDRRLILERDWDYIVLTLQKISLEQLEKLVKEVLPVWQITKK
jgi:hypothetical protein